MALSIVNYGVLIAVEKGYSANKNGDVFSKNGNKLLPYKGTCNIGTDGKESIYFCFSVRDYDGNKIRIPIHRFVAYLKFGAKSMKNGICTRHLDGDSTNNKWDNIAIGSQSENRMDIPEEKRIQMAIHATSFAKKHDHEKIFQMHKSGMSYKKIMIETGIKSKGTISFIISKSQESKKSGNWIPDEYGN